MSSQPITLQEFVDGNVEFLEVIEFLKEKNGGSLRPMEFLKIFQEELGISFVKSRDMLEYFNPQMHPLVDSEVINKHGRRILSYRAK